jgi:hypothetical protein
MNENNYISIAEKYAEWASSLSINNIPEEVKDKLKVVVMDTLGLMASAKNEPYVQSLIGALQEDGDCSVIGHNKKLSPSSWSAPIKLCTYGSFFADAIKPKVSITTTFNLSFTSSGILLMLKLLAHSAYFSAIEM